MSDQFSSSKSSTKRGDKMKKLFQRRKKLTCLKDYFGLKDRLPMINEFPDEEDEVQDDSTKALPKFTLMVIGKSGLGKTTFIKSMFLDCASEANIEERTKGFEIRKVNLMEKKAEWLVTIVDTPGYQVDVDNENIWLKVSHYIESKVAEFFTEEDKYQDPRVHCLIYFIDPIGLSPLDISYLRNIHKKVNIIPVIAKADSLTYEECQKLKSEIMGDLFLNEILVYQFDHSDDLNVILQQKMPFAFMGSKRLENIDGKIKKAREYPWCTIDVQSMEYSEFGLLELAIRCNLKKLVRSTDLLFDSNFSFYSTNWRHFSPKDLMKFEIEKVLIELQKEKKKLLEGIEKINYDIRKMKKYLDDE